ncbi:MAG: CPBP family intramembrane metalloprotease [Candidatus Pacebacteria bacterium]|nr:CPBP family intramembrane metalloprotease [Candidatus Paceibacterota bacterium]
MENEESNLLARLSKRERVELGVAQVMLFFVLPIVLLYFNIIPVEGRMVALLVFSVLIFSIIRNEGWREGDLGISTRTIRPYLIPYIFATFFSLVGIVYVAHELNFFPVDDWWTNPHFLFLFIFISIFQEFTFRGFLIPVLGRIFTDRFTIVLVNAFIFAGMHAIYSFPVTAFVFSFIGGLIFAGMYVRYPNLILVSIMHCIMNFVAVLFGFFTLGQ